MLNVRVGEKTICLMFWVRSEHMDWYKSLPAPSLSCGICHWPLIDKNSNHMAHLSCCNNCPNVSLTKTKTKKKKNKPDLPDSRESLHLEGCWWPKDLKMNSIVHMQRKCNTRLFLLYMKMLSLPNSGS